MVISTSDKILIACVFAGVVSGVILWKRYGVRFLSPEIALAMRAMSEVAAKRANTLPPAPGAV